MKLTGYGTGRTPDEAAANARSDLQDQVAAIHFGNLIAQGFGGLVSVAMTVVMQFFFRPIPTLIVGALSWLLLTILVASISSSLPEHPFGAVIVVALCAVAAIPTLMPIAAGFAVACTFVEVFERRLMNRLPDLPRIVLVGASAFAPSLFVIFLVARTVMEDKPMDIGLGGIILLMIIVAIQISVIFARQRTGEETGDYNWFGRRIVANVQTTPEQAA